MWVLNDVVSCGNAPLLQMMYFVTQYADELITSHAYIYDF